MALAKKGIDVRQSSGHLAFRALLLDTGNLILATGTTSLYLYELQSDGTLKSYDWSDNTFKATALTTETQAMTHRQGNNNTTNTGIWTYALATLTGFTTGGIYFARVRNTGALPVDQVREFQFGGVEGDVAISASGAPKVDVEEWTGNAVRATAENGVPITDISAESLAALFTFDTGKTYADGVAGSVVKEIGNASVAQLLATAYEGSETFHDFLRLSRAVLYGNGLGLDGGTPAFRDLADTKDRVAAAVVTGNRTNTLDAT